MKHASAIQSLLGCTLFLAGLTCSAGAISDDQFYGFYSGTTASKYIVAGNDPISFTLADMKVTLTHPTVGRCESVEEPYLVYSKIADASEFLESEQIIKIASSIVCDGEKLVLFMDLEEQVLDGELAKGTISVQTQDEQVVFFDQFSVTRITENAHNPALDIDLKF